VGGLFTKGAKNAIDWVFTPLTPLGLGGRAYSEGLEIGEIIGKLAVLKALHHIEYRASVSLQEKPTGFSAKKLSVFL